MNNEGTKDFTREEIRNLAKSVLDAMGFEDVQRTDEEMAVIRRALENYRRTKKIKQDNEVSGGEP